MASSIYLSIQVADTQYVSLAYNSIFRFCIGVELNIFIYCALNNLKLRKLACLHTDAMVRPGHKAYSSIGIFLRLRMTHRYHCIDDETIIEI